jgi:hypothetical protein
LQRRAPRSSLPDSAEALNRHPILDKTFLEDLRWQDIRLPPIGHWRLFSAARSATVGTDMTIVHRVPGNDDWPIRMIVDGAVKSNLNPWVRWRPGIEREQSGISSALVHSPFFENIAEQRCSAVFSLTIVPVKLEANSTASDAVTRLGE